MFQYDDLMWLISFPLVCAVMLWFSLDLAVLVRVGGGRRRRANARRAIERLILNSPVFATTTASVVQSPSPFASPTNAPSAADHSSQRSGSTPPQDRNALYHSCTQQNNSSTSAERDLFARTNATSTPSSYVLATTGKSQCLHPQSYHTVRQVAVPAALRIATRAVVRRAVVLVGGDFARSPRMQYHAASLARCGLFDEVLLVGLDCGNQLSEDLLISGEPQPERFVTREGNGKGVEQAVYDVEERLNSPEVHAGHGCIVSTRYLARPPSPPEWFQAVFPLRSLHWAVCTLYRVVALSLRFIVQTGRVTATRINEHGQLLVTDLILVQTPPAVPFVLLVKYLVCPLAFLYNVLLYYCVVVPAAWMNPDAMRDMRRECRLQSLRFQRKMNEIQGADGLENGDAKTHRKPDSTTSDPKSKNTIKSEISATPTCARRIRPWVFYPALVVDWHNYGYTILEQNQRPISAVQLYKLLEVHCCAGNVNVTVSRAMQDSLEKFYPWLKRSITSINAESPVSPIAAVPGGLVNGHTHHRQHPNQLLSPEHLPSESAVTVLYDVAPSFFRPVSRTRCVREVLHRLLQCNSISPSNAAPSNSNKSNISGQYSLVNMSNLERMGWGIAGPPAWVYADAAAETAASPQGSPSTLALPTPIFSPPAVPRRGVVMIGSTSWTEEDDYSVLIRALRRLDHRLNHEVNTSSNNNGTAVPLDLWVLITGKGPSRKRFEDAVRVAKLSSHVVVSTYYAQSYQEYSLLLGAADVGFCLHFSSSGLDLPMKGVDMVGAGLPVIALQYPAIEELMGGVTRVLAQASTINHLSNHQKVTSGSTNSLAALVECERGWVFSGDTDLEALLSSFVGLPVRETAGSLVSGVMGRGSGMVSKSFPTMLSPTPLAVMKRKAQEARLHASTWGENWTKVLLPVLKEVV